MRKLLFLQLSLFALLSSFGGNSGGELDHAFLIGKTDREPFSYEVGDEVTFTIRFEYAKPFPKGAYVLDWMHDCDIGDCYNMFYVKTNRRRGGFMRILTDGTSQIGIGDLFAQRGANQLRALVQAETDRASRDGRKMAVRGNAV